ncbi:MAG: hypothetical protein ACRDKI_07545 [Solirubrobacterales bacterium]
MQNVTKSATAHTHRKANGTVARLVLCLSLAVLGMLAVAGVASASSSQLSVMQDDGQVLSVSQAHRDAALDEMKALGVDMVKVGAQWRIYAPNPDSNSKPGIDTTDPNNYSWGALADAINGILARGMQPWIMISTPAPNWATSKSTASTQEGVYQPDPKEFGKFSEAVARRFPEVKTLSVGNEPNFLYWLYPQIGKGLVSLSAVHYRKMYVEARAGLQRGGAGHDQILFGGLAPRAFLPKVGQRATQPLRFLRDMFCLDDKLKPLKGKPAKARSCTGKFKKIDATGFAYHPYSVAGGPLIKPTSPDDAPIAYLKRLYRVLDAAAKYKRLSKRNMPLWDAEFGYQSNPPDIYATSISKIPGFLNTAEYLSYKDPRVKTYHQFQLIDDAGNSDAPLIERYGGFQSGLRFEDGSKKFGVYNAYQLPFMVFKTKSSGTVKIWGGARLKQPGATIEIQIKSGSSFKTVKTLNAGGGRYFNTTLKTAGAASKSFRFVIGTDESRTTKPVAPVKASSK